MLPLLVQYLVSKLGAKFFKIAFIPLMTANKTSDSEVIIHLSEIMENKGNNI
jgi:hypothetical protein